MQEIVEVTPHSNHCRQKRESPKLKRIRSERGSLPRRTHSLLSTSTMKPLARRPGIHSRTKSSVKRTVNAGCILACPPVTTPGLGPWPPASSIHSPCFRECEKSPSFLGMREESSGSVSEPELPQKDDAQAAEEGDLGSVRMQISPRLSYHQAQWLPPICLLWFCLHVAVVSVNVEGCSGCLWLSSEGGNFHVLRYGGVILAYPWFGLKFTPPRTACCRACQTRMVHLL